MVISYTIQELTDIGKIVMINECLKRIQIESAAQLQPPPSSPQTTAKNPFICHKSMGQIHFPSFTPATVTSNNDRKNPFMVQIPFADPSATTISSTIPVTSTTELDMADPLASQGELTIPVAEFFRKAQRNFCAQISIDPTKVRRLSEVEAELISRRDSQ